MSLEELLNNTNIVMTINQNMDTLLCYIPEIEEMIGFDQKHPHHHYDLWNHTLLALYIAEENVFLDYDVRLALLLHDIGKPVCFIDGDIRHYYNHSLYSAKIAKRFFKRTNYSKQFIKRVLFLIKNHDCPISDILIDKDPLLAKKLYEVQYCDSLAHNPKYLRKRLDYLSGAKIKLIKRGITK